MATCYCGGTGWLWDSDTDDESGDTHEFKIPCPFCKPDSPSLEPPEEGRGVPAADIDESDQTYDD